MVAGAGYSAKDVARLLDLSPAQVRSLVRDGCVEGKRGARGEYRFSFQDLVLLRVARELRGARVKPRRIRRALSALRERLPVGRSLSALKIGAEGDRVVVHDGTKRWNPESGQLHFAFEVKDLARDAAPLARAQARAARDRELSAEDWYELGCDLEAPAPSEAREAYARALAIDPHHVEANVNLGRLLHEAGDAAGAEARYRVALAACPEDATAAFNLGVALEDQGRLEEALDAYRRALAADPRSPDAHYNASGLCERLGKREEALRHLRSYREMTQGSGA
ncbi:MAG TPA: tetratricopeptide repeat protein [Planctomycetota bacterium]|nr:tetratricopeptide repeat protein [Planctomycetota bacterium]